MNSQSPLTRKGRKVDQVLHGAREIFLRDGFEGASVDDIARAAGVSKATLYSYFSDKRQLFQEVVQSECDRMATRIVGQINENAPVRERLITAAYGAGRFIVSDFAQRIFRICVAERDRFPELGQAYYASGPAKGHAEVRYHLKCAVEQGELVINDIDMAAHQFTELCKTRVFIRACFGVQSDFSDDEMKEIATEAVETFLARYGA
ncbi:TetR/AcrR family transcriptional regulator [Cognatishimia sp. SS12]|uniref:TetR/AcrR family transcriptional regulator n=1 Tax=Cognatishimia sp. SS12 TaxID=2979465 RepID=UPI00232A9808|nr:TetR/AcrR family transcriptional regulator [Cognatishimia sp. SS12]MDC0737560.1 TetR/AcrR family transcriptional regulator [Cognatishimia sp. SS12]